MRTHNRSFIIFAVTSVTDSFLICYNTRDYLCLWMRFNKSRRMPLKKSTVRSSKNVYFAADLSSISTHFPSVLYPECDICDSKKTTSLLEVVRTRVRERESSHSGHFVREIHLVCNVSFSLCVCFKEKSADYCDFFTLCPHFNAYMFRG